VKKGSWLAGASPGVRALAAVWFVWAAGHAVAQVTALPGGLTLTDMTLRPNLWAHGVVERRYVIENPTPFTHTVTLDIPGRPYSGSELQSLAETVVVGPGTRASVAMTQPPVGMSGSGTVGVRVKGKPQLLPSSPAPSFEIYPNNPLPSILVSKGLSAEALKARMVACAPEEAGGRSGYSRSWRGVTAEEFATQNFTRQRMEELQPFRFEGEGAAWPDHWLAFSAFDGCVIAAADDEKMPVEARNALRAYVAAGGHLLFTGRDALPEGWIETGGETPRRLEGESWTEARYGFGTVSVTGMRNFAEFQSNDVVRLSRAWHIASHPWLGIRNSAPACITEIPVIGNLRVPVNRFLLILLIFTLIAGPGAVIVTGRTNRRIWLLVLVPAVSILFSAAILVYALVSEGITPSLRRQAVTLLDQTQRRAVTLGAVGVYAPTALRDGLHFDRGTEVSPLSAVRSARITCGRDQHYADGWSTPRLPAFFRLRRSEERAERLLIEDLGEGRAEVVNALGAPILRLRLCDREGRLYEARDLAPGEKRLLTTTGTRPADAPSASDALRTVYQSPLPGWGLPDLAKKMLQGTDAPSPGAYVAVLDGCPFLENPLAYCRTRETSQSIVAGTF